MLFSFIFFMMIDTNNYCAVCHSDIQAEYMYSVHLKEQIKCTDCHGGNAQTDEMSKAHGGDFKGKLDKKMSLQICSSCHSDLKKMKPYGLPADQYALYVTSYHGMAFAKGDMNVAVCTDCHSSHKIVKSGEPASPVYKMNIVSTCTKCHTNKEMMKKYNLSYEVGPDYLQSIHAEELFKKGNSQAPSCAECHGTHGASPPGVADVGKICGHCHVSARDNFLISPHKNAMDAKQLPECASCHENHKVKRTDIADFNSMCQKCHARNTAPAILAKKMFTLFNGTKEQLERAQGAIREAESIPINVEDYKSSMEEAYTYYTRAHSITHSLSIELFKDLLDKSRYNAEKIQSEIHGKESGINDRKLILLALWFYIIITIVIIYQYKKGKAEQK